MSEVAADTAAAGDAGAPAREGRAGNPGERLLAAVRGNPMVPLLFAGAAAVAVVVALLMWATAPQYRVLYSNLSDADGGRIIEELETRGVPYRFGGGGRALMVPGDRVHDLRLRLAQQGLPQAGNVGLEIMDGQDFGISQFAERVNYQRGLQGELAQSIETLGPVAHARVHLALAKPSVFVREQEPAKASVVVTLQPGRALGDGQTTAITHMVSSSVPELAAKDVTVVDQNGNLLSRNGDGAGALDGSQLDYVKRVERSYRERIERILAPIVGRDNVRAQVTAQLDFTRREETSETYSPNQGDRPAAIRSRQISSARDGRAGAAGVPGALTNTPPGAQASPIDAADQGGADEPQEPETDAGRVREENVVNYELDRNVSHVRHPYGSLERLSVAVVVNYREGRDERGQPVAQPLDDEQMERIRQLAHQAMGYSWARGDELEIVNAPFTEEEEPPSRAWWESPGLQHLLLTLGRYLLAALAVALIYLRVLRPLLQRYASALTARTAAAGEEELPAERPRRQHKPSYEQNLKDLQNMAQEDPGMIAVIVRSWLKRND